MTIKMQPAEKATTVETTVEEDMYTDVVAVVDTEDAATEGEIGGTASRVTIVDNSDMFPSTALNPVEEKKINSRKITIHRDLTRGHPRYNKPRKREKADGTIEYWCSACGKWGNHYRTNHPANTNPNTEPINAGIAAVAIHSQPPASATLGAMVPVAEMHGQASHTSTAPQLFGNVADTDALARLRAAGLIERKGRPCLISSLTGKEMIHEVVHVLSPQRDTGEYASIC